VTELNTSSFKCDDTFFLTAHAFLGRESALLCDTPNYAGQRQPGFRVVLKLEV
jgi:hypothetical protein